jgi:hypothetical protein
MMHVSTRHHYHENYATRQRLEIIKWPKGNAAGTNIAVQLLATVIFTIRAEAQISFQDFIWFHFFKIL